MRNSKNKNVESVDSIRAEEVSEQCVRLAPESPERSVKSGIRIEGIFTEAKARKIRQVNVQCVCSILLISAQGQHRAGGDGHAWLVGQLKASERHLAENPTKHQLQQVLATRLALAYQPVFHRNDHAAYRKRVRQAAQERLRAATPAAEAL